MNYLENIKAQIRKGILEFAILVIIEKTKEIYASDVLKNLKKAEITVVEGTLYPLLNRLKRHELLEYAWKESKSGPPRKYYKLTVKGKAALDGLKDSWKSLYTSINSLIKES